MQRITDRAELIEYIIANKANAGILRDFSDDEVRAWAEPRDTASIQSVASGIWKDGMDMLGVTV